jgi:hypothetical protein
MKAQWQAARLLSVVKPHDAILIGVFECTFHVDIGATEAEVDEPRAYTDCF